jgi:predicted Ser/Thr protein kinase/intein/homing endonuclease
MAMDLIKKLEEFRAQEQSLTWTGTFEEYFGIVTGNPRVAQLAHARIYDMIVAGGVEDQAGLPHYKFFDDEIFGLDRSIQQIVEYFSSGAQRLEVRKRILLLMGPVGGGKSSIVSLLKRGLEGYTRMAAGAVYAIASCPMQEEPLHLIPAELRGDIEREYGLYIEGDLCPRCRFDLESLYEGHIERVPVKRIAFSEKKRVGIGTFSPSDPKCVTGDAILLTDRGMLRFDEIQKQVAGREDEFVPFSVGVSGKAGGENTSHFYNGGVKATRRISTRLGYEIEGSMVHPVLVMSGGRAEWVKLSDLQVGDYVALQRGSNLFGNLSTLPEFNYRGPASKGQNRQLTLPTTMTSDLARLLGYIVAEGSLTDTALWVTNGERRVLDDIIETCQTLFSVRPKEYRKAGTYAKSLSISSIELVHWLEQVCGITRGAANKRIPQVIMRAPKAIVLAFFEGLFWGDGTISARKALKSNRFKMASASVELARQTQTVLLNLGIVSALYKETIKDRFTVYSVVVLGDAVMDLVGLIPSLREKCTDGVEALIQPRGGTNFDHVPGLEDTVRLLISEISYGHKSAVSRYRRYATASPSWGRTLTRSSLNTLVSEAEKLLPDTSTNLALLKEHLDPTLLWLEVQHITEGTAQVYDLTVPGSHSFCANGFINHNSQDVSELTGSIDLSTIGEYGSESDPRAYRFDGELNVANRGMCEFIEMLKVDERFLYVLLTLSQEQNIKTGRFSMIYADEVVVSHTNETEYRTFVGNKKSEALQDRIILVKVPYNLRASDEVRIYDKLLKQSALKNVHIAPHTLDVASIFAVLTRLEPSKKAGMTAMKKLKLYDGVDVDGFKAKDLKELQDEQDREGMDGISPRYVINRLSSALVREGVTCINPIDALRALRDGLEQHTSVTREQREHYLNLLGEARKEYDEIAKREVQKAFVYSFEESARTLLNNYLDNVEAYCNHNKMRDQMTDEEVEPDEALMKSIEEQIGVGDTQRKAFREEILIRISSLARRGQSFDYTSHERLREAIEKKLFADLRDVVKITTSTKTPDQEQLRRINGVIDRLVEEHGYCTVCANALLQYVGSLLNR